MNDFENFKKYMYLYKKCINIEKKFKELGIDLNPEAGLLNLLDELISWIPDLIITNPDNFWNAITYDEFNDEEFDQYIEKLWNEIKQ